MTDDELQGPQGEQGVRGFEGPQGLQGPSSRNYKQQVKHDKNVTISFWILVIVTTILVSIFSYQLAKTHSLAKENQKRIAETVLLRKQIVTNSTQADYKLCKEIKTLKGGFRAAALRNFNNLDRNLKLLRLPKTPEITAAATSDLNSALTRYRDIKCIK